MTVNHETVRIIKYMEWSEQKEEKQERHRSVIEWFDSHPVFVSLFFGATYLLLFFAVEHVGRSSHIMVHSRLDDLIPFVKYAAPFYYIWFAALLITFLVFLFHESRTLYWKLFTSMVLCTMLSILLYFLIPNGVNLRPSSISGSDLFSWMVRMIWKADNPYNVCPSLHVSTSLILDLLWQESSLLKTPAEKAGIHLTDGLIMLSTVLLKQHSVIDVGAGILFGWLMYRLGSFLTERFYC